jgi:predicted nucleic acid-binding protein
VAQVLDASVAIAWCVRSQETPLSVAALYAVEAHGAHVPSPFWYEVLYGLAGLQLRRIVSADDISGFLSDAVRFNLIVDQAHGTVEMIELRRLGETYALSVYDASYLELALRTGLPLATRDNALAVAAKKAGATIFTP